MKLLIFMIFFSGVTSVMAQDIELDAINQSDLDKINSEFSAALTHNPVSPAHGLGDLWGVEVGLVGGLTQVPDLEKLVQEQKPNQSLSTLPSGAIFAAVTIPYGLTGELSFIPETDFGDVDVETSSFALKWTFSQVFFPKLPLHMALRGHLASSEINFAQTINNGGTNVDSTITFENSVSGAHLLAGFDFFIIEPYLGIGFINGESDVTVTATGNATIFDTNFTTGQTASADDSSLHFFTGLQFDLPFFNLAFEYATLFDTSRISTKLSLAF